MLEVSGSAKILNPELRGFYSIMNFKIEERPVYKNDANRKPLYLFYQASNNDGFWIISTKFDDLDSVASVNDNASIPENITATWQQLDLSAFFYRLKYRQSPSIKVKCIDSGKTYYYPQLKKIVLVCDMDFTVYVPLWCCAYVYP